MCPQLRLLWKQTLAYTLPCIPMPVSHSPQLQVSAHYAPEFASGWELPVLALTFHHPIPSSRHKVLLVGMQAGDRPVVTSEGSHTGATENVPVPTEHQPKRCGTR